MSNNRELIDNLDILIQTHWIKDQQIQEIIIKLKEMLEIEEPSINQEDLIFVPMNQLVKEAKDLWWAEAVAFFYNVLWTAFVNTFTKDTLTLSLAWPVIEKIWFVVREYAKAVIERKKTWKPISQWFKENVSNGLKNLVADIVVHDSIYTSIMAYGISNNMFDAWILSIISFFIALGPAIIMKYSGNELSYHIQKNLTKLNWFQREKYYEARFIFNNHHKPLSIFEEAWNKFWLWNYDMNTYNDKYFDHSVLDFSDRKWTVKHRTITDFVTWDTVSNLEIAHTLAKKDYLSKNGVYNFFYSSKEKWKKDLKWNDIETILKRFPYRAIIKNPSKEVSFEREILFDNEVRITLDKIIAPTNDEIKSVIEVKAYKDTKQLMELMQFIMSKWNIRLTTQWKKDLL
jgi:hypothetical protein